MEIPVEYWQGKADRTSKVAKLQKSLDGTRDAARNWQAHVKTLLTQAGIQTGDYTQCSFSHKNGLLGMVHGDDFVIVGTEGQLIEIAEYLDQKLQLKKTFLGARKESEVRNRVQDPGKDCEVEQDRMGV